MTSLALNRGLEPASLRAPSQNAPFAGLNRWGYSNEVGVLHRLATAVFGSSRVARANGSYEAFSSYAGDAGRRSGREAPVYAFDMPSRARSGQLPRVWISEPVGGGGAAHPKGREIVASYPCDDDPCGEKAFGFARAYFGEALSYCEPQDARLRVECFRASELLLLHAVSRGSVEADVQLGVLYEGDLCEGVYYGAEFGSCEEAAGCLDAMAFERFHHAAASGSAEACCRLGDLVGAGRGCQADPSRAFALYVRAFEMTEGTHVEAYRGISALRVAEAYEGGCGCEQSFRRAYAWYRIAEDELAYVIDEGGWFFKKPRSRASVGVRRMRQELVGGY